MFQSCLTLSDPMDHLPTWFLCPWDSPGKSTGAVAVPSSGYLQDPGTQLMSLVPPALTGGFFTTSVTWEASQ